MRANTQQERLFLCRNQRRAAACGGFRLLKSRVGLAIACFSLLLGFRPSRLPAQKFHVSTYTTLNGLPTDVVRHALRDTFGFLWLATDAGLVRFDGVRFQVYSKEAPSQYGRHLQPVGEGIAYSHDAGVSLIRPGLDTVQIDLLLPGTALHDQAELYYPNALFVRRNGALWIGQPDGRLARWQAGKLTFFPVGDQAVSGRSDSRFYFVETEKGVLWVACQSGLLLAFDEQKQQFAAMASLGPLNAMVRIGQELWLGGERLYRLTLSADQRSIRRRTAFTSAPGAITAMGCDPDGNIYAGISGEGLYYLDRRSEPPAFKPVFSNNDPHRVDPLPFKQINYIHLNRRQELWISSQEGFGILQKRFFESADALPNGNTTSIVAGDSSEIFVNFGDVFRVYPTRFGFEAEALPSLRRGALTSLAAAPGGLWAGTSNGELLQLTKRGRLLRSQDLSERGEGIFYLFRDAQERIWLCQAPHEQPITGVACRLPDGRIRIYDERHGLHNRILVVKESPNGRIYAAGIGPSTYLYRYLPEKDAFLNLSLPLDFPVGQNFEVHDLAVNERGQVWLATTDGLLRYDLDRVQRVELGAEYRDVEIRSVATLPDGGVWLSTDTKGLLRLHRGEVVAMKEESGLPSKIMAYRALLVDHHHRLWAGTAEGVVYSFFTDPRPLKTAPPLLLSASVNGAAAAASPVALRPGDSLQLRFCTPAFHGYELFYQHRWNDGKWSPDFLDNRLTLTPDTPGAHRVLVRARKAGGFAWSDPLTVHVEMKQPWHRRPAWRMGGMVLLLAALGWGLYGLVRRFGALRAEVSRQAADMLRIKGDLDHEKQELRLNRLSLELLRRLILKISPDTKWEDVLDILSVDLLRLPGVAAFEIAHQSGREVLAEGCANSAEGFLVRSYPFAPAENHLSYGLTLRRPAILDERLQQIMAGNGAYRSGIAAPFLIEQHRKAAIFLYSDQENYFDADHLAVLGLLAAYLEQIT